MNGGRLSISSATTSSGTFSGTLAGSGTLDISGQATQYLQTGNTVSYTHLRAASSNSRI